MLRVLLIAGFLVVVPPAHAQDAQAGKIVFESICNLCHEAGEGQNRVGPSLYGVVGRRAGTISGFTYSEVVKGSGIIWTETELDKWISGPKRYVPGTRMSYAGLTDEQMRHDLIAYLKTLHH